LVDEECTFNCALHNMRQILPATQAACKRQGYFAIQPRGTRCCTVSSRVLGNVYCSRTSDNPLEDRSRIRPIGRLLSARISARIGQILSAQDLAIDPISIPNGQFLVPATPKPDFSARWPLFRVVSRRFRQPGFIWRESRRPGQFVAT
jgi:hypothetical protein